MKTMISIIIWIVGTVLTITLWIVDLVLTIILFPFDKKRKVTHAQSFWWADALIGINPYWNVHVEGIENIDHNKTYVVIANHQSLADIIVLYKTRMQFKWVAKDSLFKVPFVGWCLSLGKHIRITRGELGSIKKIYREAADWLRKDMSVLFFPEGTRSETSQMNKFQNGAFKLAIKEKRPILPIRISGTGEAIPKGSWVFKTKVSPSLKILSPIDTEDLSPGDFAKLRDEAFSKLQDANN